MVTASVALSVCEQQESCNVVCRNDENLFFISDIILVLEHQEMAGVDTMPCWMSEYNFFLSLKGPIHDQKIRQHIEAKN